MPPLSSCCWHVTEEFKITSIYKPGYLGCGDWLVELHTGFIHIELWIFPIISFHKHSSFYLKLQQTFILSLLAKTNGAWFIRVKKKRLKQKKQNTLLNSVKVWRNLWRTEKSHTRGIDWTHKFTTNCFTVRTGHRREESSINHNQRVTGR